MKRLGQIALLRQVRQQNLHGLDAV